MADANAPLTESQESYFAELEKTNPSNFLRQAIEQTKADLRERNAKGAERG